MKYIPSIAFEEMSGSAKGVTAAKVKGRKFIKNRGYGGRIGTVDQAKNKGVMKMITTKWKSLTNEQILAWNKLALSQDAKSVLGTKGKISGLNLFQRLNFWVVKLGGNIMLMPPTLTGVETPPTATIVCSSAAFTFKLDQELSDNGGIYLIIQASEGQSNGVTRGYGKAVQIMDVEEPGTDAIDIKSAYESQARCPGHRRPEGLLQVLPGELLHRRDFRADAGTRDLRRGSRTRTGSGESLIITGPGSGTQTPIRSKNSASAVAMTPGVFLVYTGFILDAG